MTTPHLYLVDGSGYIFRAYHRLPPLTNKLGQPAGAVYGYTAMLWKLASDLNAADGPTHMAVILDASSKTFRNDLYDQYKANRPPPPEDLVPQFPMIRDATRAFSIPCIEAQGLEADDLIAAYTAAARARGWAVTIVSSDKDLMQLIAPGVDLLDTMNNRRIGPEAVIEKFGVPPGKLGDVLALMGDSVDNVPGVPGVGPKTAAQLIQDYGDLETVLANAESIKKPKLRQSLIDHADAARLSRRLVTLDTRDPVPVPLDDLALTGIPDAPLRAFLDHHGFRSLLSRLDGGPRAPAGTAATKAKSALQAATAPGAAGSAPPVAVPQTFDRAAYVTITDAETLERWLAEAVHEGVLAFDTETDGRDPQRARLVGFSIATVPGRAAYVPLMHGGSDLLAEKPVQIPVGEALARLKRVLEDPAVLKIGHNLKFDINVLARHAIAIAPIDDTLVMSFDLDAGQTFNHGMDDLAERHFDHKCIAFTDVCGSGKKAITFDQVPVADATRYAAEDADVTLRLHRAFLPRMALESATTVYQRVDRPLVPVIAAMERRGILVDRARLADLSEEFAAQMARIEGEVHALAGTEFALGSPKQLGEILFDQMGLKGGRKGKSGVYSTDASELERLAADGVDIARKLLDWRQVAKLKSTYTDALQAQINPETGRVHTSYSLVGAQTGRLSSNDPNLQNIPIRTENGRKIREAFVAAPGNVLLSADYSQIELRLAAHIADVPELRAAFLRDEDIHALTARELFGEVNRETRGRAKTINFAILYGISRWGLAARLGIRPEEAQAMIDRYFERFPGVSRYIADTLASVRETGFTTTLFGRKTHFPRIAASNQAERQGSERAAINAPIQGTSADIIKRAMARMDGALAEAGLGDVAMLLQVHDELVFELPEARVEAATPVIRSVMANAAAPMVELSVPLGVEIGWGKSWGEAH